MAKIPGSEINRYYSYASSNTNNNNVNANNNNRISVTDQINVSGSSSSTNFNTYTNNAYNLSEKILNIGYINNQFNKSSEVIDCYILENLDAIALLAEPHELKEIYCYISNLQSYKASTKIYNKITDQDKLNDSEAMAKNMILFYATAKDRKDFQKYVENDPGITNSIKKEYSSISHKVKHINEDNLKSASGVYLRFITKRFVTIAAIKNNNLTLAENSIKYAMDNFKISFNCCSTDPVAQNKLIGAFLDNFLILKSNAIENYVKNNIDIFKDNLNDLKNCIYLTKYLTDMLAFDVLENKSFADQIHQYLRANSDLVYRQDIGHGLYDYNRHFHNISHDTQSYQEWNYTIWQLLKNDYVQSEANNNDKNDAKFLATSLNIIATSHILDNKKYNQKILDFFRNTPTGIFLDQCEKFLFNQKDYDINVIRSIKEKDIHFSILVQFKSLKSEGKYKISIKDIKNYEHYTKNKKATVANLVHIIGNHKEARLIFDKVDPNQFNKDFSLMICYVLLNNNRQTFKKINNSDFSLKAKSWLHLLAAETFAASKDKLSLAQKHVDKAIELNPNNDFVSLKTTIEVQMKKTKDAVYDKNNIITNNNNLAQIIPKDESTVVSISTNNTNAILAEIDNSEVQEIVSQDEDNYDQEEYLMQLDPSRYHEHWQSVKNNRINELPNTVVLYQSNALISEIVNINGYSIDLAQTASIYDRFNVQHYVYMPIKTQQDLGQEYTFFESAMAKGFVRFKEGQSGIKYFGEGAAKGNAEVKSTSSSNRVRGKLYIHDNKRIFIFDQIGNHKKTKKGSKK